MSIRIIPHPYIGDKESGILLVSMESYTKILDKVKDISTIPDQDTRLKELCLLIGLNILIFQDFSNFYKE